MITLKTVLQEQLEKHGARVIRLEKDIPGWMGKSLAAYTGARAAKGDMLLFLDAIPGLNLTGLTISWPVIASMAGL
ncbi:MAG: hypothetical protein U5N58_01300 [Actinomycetota bacterium]|nr:hypothetical protein [Actinomycetota bacterium]